MNEINQMTTDMEIKRMWQRMEEQQRAEYESMLALFLVFLISGLLIVDILIGFAWSDPLIRFAETCLERLAAFAEWVHA